MKYALLALVYLPVHVFVARLMYVPLRRYCYITLDWDKDTSNISSFFFSLLWPASILLTFPVFLLVVAPIKAANRHHTRRAKKKKAQEDAAAKAAAEPSEMEKDLLSALGLVAPDPRLVLDRHSVAAYIQANLLDEAGFKKLVEGTHRDYVLS